jgi:fibroblast growth factor receptor 1
MNHLACSNVVHRDLAARNILLAADARSVKIADFGLARDVLGFGIYEQKSEVRLPIRWMAPEFLFKGKSSTASDVWSFGVLLWEIGTLGATPYGQSPSEAVMRSVRVGERLQRPSHCSTEFFKVVEECWAEQPELRPSFASIVGKLHSHLALADSIDVMNFHEGLYQKLPSDVPDEKC